MRVRWGVDEQHGIPGGNATRRQKSGFVDIAAHAGAAGIVASELDGAAAERNLQFADGARAGNNRHIVVMPGDSDGERKEEKRG